MILIREKRLKMDIYEAKRQQVLDEIKKLEGSFLKDSFDTSIVVQGSVCWSLRVSRN
jgi:hypothetical protein